MRKLTKSIALVSLLAPATALPLGVGEIKLHSALNQNLNAEIELLISGGENPSDIKVKLAPPDKFDEAGLPWSYFLSKIKFKLVTLSNGRAIVKLTSNEALREPFLDFLLEVTWPKGNLYREFTVLVDPPSSYKQPVVPVTSAQLSRSAQKAYARTADQTQAPSSSRSRPGDVYRVRKNDTLWQVAARVKPTNQASVEQTMIALYDTNPNAFFKENVNALKAGSKLKVPGTDVILKLSHREALSEFARQNKAWQGQVSEKPEISEVAEKETIDSQLSLLAPSESEIAESQNVVSDDGKAENEANLQPSQKPASAESGEQSGDQELQARMEKLEQQLAIMQQMLNLKDEQLAALQNQQPSDLSAQVKPIQPETQKATAPVPAVQQPPKAEAKPAPVQPIVEDDSAGFYYWFLAVLSMGLLGGLGWMWWQKRQDETEIDTDSMFAASSQISLPTSDEEEEQLNIPSMDDASSYDVGTVGESSFLSEFTPSDFDSFDGDQHEVDPISEADVYLAYGRYQQAEELIRQAISVNPENDDYKLKLLEIFYANENKSAFENYATELKAAGKTSNTSFWAKVIEMGSEISPGSALFSADFRSLDDEEDFAIQDQFDDDLSDEETQRDNDNNDVSDDLDLALFGQAEPGSSETEDSDSDVSLSENGLDFDLSDFGATENNKTQKGPLQAAPESQDNNIEFDVSSLVKADIKTQETAKKSNDSDIESFDFDFSLPEVDKNKSKQSSVAEAKKSDADFDFSFDLNNAISSDQDDKSLDFNLGVSDLTDMDEFETKIDLARAYIDMGDISAAKDIAEEVLEKGNTDQQLAAQAILDEITS